MTMMRRGMLALVLAGIASAASADDETVSARQKSFRVQYADGASETYVAHYRALVSYRRWQTGEASKPLSGHIIDDRQCHWEIVTQIVREVCLTSRSGQQFCQGALSRIYGTSKAGKGSDFQLLRLHPETCTSAEARYNSDVNDAKNAVQAALDPIVDGDFGQVQQDMQSALKARSVTSI